MSDSYNRAYYELQNRRALIEDKLKTDMDDIVFKSDGYVLKPISKQEEKRTHNIIVNCQEPGLMNAREVYGRCISLTEHQAKALAYAIQELIEHITQNFNVSTENNFDLTFAIDKARSAFHD